MLNEMISESTLQTVYFFILLYIQSSFPRIEMSCFFCLSVLGKCVVLTIMHQSMWVSNLDRGTFLIDLNQPCPDLKELPQMQIL
jgi:hypothetical protein